MFINFSNHPNCLWSPEQIAAARTYGEIVDIPFPNVDPNKDEDYIEKLAEDCVTKIAAHKPAAVLCQGEMTLAFAVATRLKAEWGITVLAACSERVSTETMDEKGTTQRKTQFRFVRFRKYCTQIFNLDYES